MTVNLCNVTKSEFSMFQACTYDHVELNFYHNGKHLHCPLTGMKGTVYPVFYGKYQLIQCYSKPSICCGYKTFTKPVPQYQDYTKCNYRPSLKSLFLFPVSEEKRGTALFKCLQHSKNITQKTSKQELDKIKSYFLQLQTSTP